MGILAIVRIVAPEFSSVVDDTVNSWITLTKPLVSAKKFGDLYNQAVALLTCHRMKLSGQFEAATEGGSGVAEIMNLANTGKVTSYSEGDVSIGFSAGSSAGSTSSSDYYATTPYGQQYLELLRGLVVPINIRR